MLAWRNLMVSGRAWEDFPGKYACVSHKVFVSAIPSGCDAHLTFVRKLPKIVKLSLLNVNGKRYFSRRGEKFPSASVLDRYVVVQLIPPMVLGIAVFSALGVSMGVGPELSDLLGRAGVRWPTLKLAVRLVLLRAPAYLGFALPVASLLAALLTFGRMGADNEIVALRSCGLSAWRIVQPAILMFIAVTLLHLFLTEKVIPVTNRKAEVLKSGTVSSFQDTVTPQLEIRTTSSQPVIYLGYQKGKLRHMFYAQRVDGEKLLNATFVEMQLERSDVMAYEKRSGMRLSKVISAESATWSGSEECWIFENGAEYVIQLSAVVGPATGAEAADELHAGPDSCALQSVAQFKTTYSEGLSRAPLELAKLQHGQSFDDMTLSEVSKLLHLLAESRNMSEWRRIQVKLQQRLALPFACLVFGMVGSLVSLNLRRDQKKLGLAWMLVIVFAYYVVNVFGSVLGQLNVVSPLVGAWMPNLVGVASLPVLQRRADL